MNPEAKKRALYLLDKRDYSRQMLIDKLVEKQIPLTDAQEVADWLCEIGAVSDARYAELLVRHYSAKGYGKQRICQEFYRHGISKDLWDDALQELPDAEDTVLQLLKNKLQRTDCTLDDIRRAENSLLRRGYSWEQIKTALEQYKHELELE